MNATTESMIGTILRPVFETLPPEVAQQIASLGADPGLQAEVEELARKASEGSLTPEEEQRYQDYIDAGDILATIQAMARRTLKQSSD